ncbi:MAG: PQQ-dependent sugar dehydrogenase [Byssovorax sp.]
MTGNYDCSPPVGVVPALKLTEVANGTSYALFAIPAPGDDTRMFIVSKNGKIWILQGDNNMLPAPFLDISSIVHQPSGMNNGVSDERGLLGLAFHPKYAQNGRFFIYYTDQNTANGSSGDQHLAEYKRSANDPNLADPKEVQSLFVEPDFESNHNGGGLAFSPKDGFLFIGMGDGGGGGDQHGMYGNGQDLSKRWGKMLRLDVDSATKPYGIPPGNMTIIPPEAPPVGSVNPEIWDFGLRNPWRFSFDACTSDLYIGDVGQNKFEEIDVEPAGQGNKNYGWRTTEAAGCYPPLPNPMDETCDKTGITLPVASYSHALGCSVNGGYVYRGSKIPGLRGTYFYGDYCSGKIWTFSWPADVAMDPALTGKLRSEINPVQFVSFGQDNAGEIYVIQHRVYDPDPAKNLPGGKIFRIEAQ